MISIPTPRNFLPSDMVQQRGMLTAPGNIPFIHSNGHYQGNRNSNANRHQITNLADDLNCALFLRNIPMSASLSGVFDMVDTGAVYALHIMPPNGQYHTCAAKLTFMTPDGAAMFLAKARQGIRLEGYLLDARYNNREGYLCNTTALSRVLHVEGPETIMKVDYWFRYFRQVCVFQWDRVVELACPRPGRKCLEFRFARINGQAQTCLQEIQQQEEFAGLVDAGYGFDPCDQLTLQDMV
ncbi:hypothetical protein BDZ45DRAFT_584314 [Acephala macrosclerotiorum]|nr:hypothetical protein BDZ45DRAFT_584314 [Acephala macrosclerotiorum]